MMIVSVGNLNYFISLSVSLVFLVIFFIRSIIGLSENKIKGKVSNNGRRGVCGIAALSEKGLSQKTYKPHFYSTSLSPSNIYHGNTRQNSENSVRFLHAVKDNCTFAGCWLEQLIIEVCLLPWTLNWRSNIWFYLASTIVGSRRFTKLIKPCKVNPLITISSRL